MVTQGIDNKDDMFPTEIQCLLIIAITPQIRISRKVFRDEKQGFEKMLSPFFLDGKCIMDSFYIKRNRLVGYEFQV